MTVRTVCLTAVLVVFAAAPALADQTIAPLGRQAPIAAYGGWTAWSRFDEASGRYALVLRDPSGVEHDAPVPASAKPFDVSLGPDAGRGAAQKVLAIYRHCSAHGCDLRVLDVATGAQRTLKGIASSYRAATPAIWRSNVVFTRRVNGCDIPYLKNLRSSKPSRRLLKNRKKCLQTAAGHTAIRGSRIVISSVDTSGADASGAGRKVSELRVYSTFARGSALFLGETFGEESNLFGQVALDDRYVYTEHYGVFPPDAFMRVPFSTGRPEEATAARALTGSFAKPDASSFVYVEQQGATDGACDGFTDVPCRVVLSTTNPWSQARALTPQLTVAYVGQPRSGQPLTFTGALTVAEVTAHRLLGTTPVAGITVELYHRTGANPERFEPTGLRAVTGPDGTYSIVLPAAGADPWYTAVAATPGVETWAGRGTVGSVAP
jgi:hypothetical protein